MPSEKTNNTIALTLTIVFVIVTLFYGLIVIDRPFFTSIIIILGLPLYLIWRYL